MSNTFFQGVQKVLQGGFATTALPGHSPGNSALKYKF